MSSEFIIAVKLFQQVFFTDRMGGFYSFADSTKHTHTFVSIQLL